MLSDEIQMLFDNASSALGQIRGGRVRGLAVASKTRAVALPDVPTFAESGVANFYTSILRHLGAGVTRHRRSRR
jgi:tripartite-type tricarboxylate transporter receptor subunit TctC